MRVWNPDRRMRQLIDEGDYNGAFVYGFSVVVLGMMVMFGLAALIGLMLR